MGIMKSSADSILKEWLGIVAIADRETPVPHETVRAITQPIAEAIPSRTSGLLQA